MRVFLGLKLLYNFLNLFTAIFVLNRSEKLTSLPSFRQFFSISLVEPQFYVVLVVKEIGVVLTKSLQLLASER